MKKFSKIISLILSVFVVCFVLTACAPKTVDEAMVKMEEKGYMVVLIDQDYYLTEGAIIGFKAYNMEGTEGMLAFWFESSKEAKNFVDTWIDDMYPVKKSSGKCAYAGTVKAIEDFKS